VPAFAQTTARDWFTNGIALINQGKCDEAVQSFNEAIEINPQNADAWYNKGRALGINCKLDDAIQAFDKAIEINPQLAQAWYNKGNVLMGLGDYDGAIKAYDESHKLSPPGIHYTWYYTAIALDKLGKYEEAIRAYDKAIEISAQMDAPPEPTSGKHINPSGQMWNAKGLALQALGRNTEAQAAFAKAKELGAGAPTTFKGGCGKWKTGSSSGSFAEAKVSVGVSPKTSVILDENYSLVAAVMLPPAHRKTAAERFAGLKKNITK